MSPLRFLSQQLFLAQFNTIKTIADNEDCVFIGRCADYALKDDYDILSVFINSDEKSKIERISKVNLAILRIAVYEMKYVDDVPDKVALNEAIEICKKYSDEKSVSFVNGVLGAYSRSLGENNA